MMANVLHSELRLKEFAKKLQKIAQSGPCSFLTWEKHTFEVVRAGHRAPKDSEHLVHDSLTLKNEFAMYKMDYNVRTSPGESRVVDFLPHFFPFLGSQQPALVIPRQS